MSSPTIDPRFPSRLRRIGGYIAAAIAGALLVLVGIFAAPLLNPPEAESGPQENLGTVEDIRSAALYEPDSLAPKDLGITKQRFVQHPKAGEVTIFRTTTRDRLKPTRDQTYDQILWTGGDEARVDVVLVPMSYYKEPGPYDPNAFFRESWRLSANAFSHRVEGYGFNDATWSQAGPQISGKLAFSKAPETGKSPSEDLIFEFEMFVLSLEDAKRLHPSLDINRDKGSTSWGSAFLHDHVMPPESFNRVKSNGPR